jgi:hypothetical protein
MKDEHEPLSNLLTKLQRNQKEKLEADLRAIIGCADQYVPEMKHNTSDEFLYHVGEIRQRAGELLEECVKVSDIGPEVLTRIKEKFEELKSFVEYWIMLRIGPEAVERAHVAL